MPPKAKIPAAAGSGSAKITSFFSLGPSLSKGAIAPAKASTPSLAASAALHLPAATPTNVSATPSNVSSIHSSGATTGEEEDSPVQTAVVPPVIMTFETEKTLAKITRKRVIEDDDEAEADFEGASKKGAQLSCLEIVYK